MKTMITALIEPGTGIPAIDESLPTIEKRLSHQGVPRTTQNPPPGRAAAEAVRQDLPRSFCPQFVHRFTEEAPCLRFFHRNGSTKENIAPSNLN